MWFQYEGAPAHFTNAVYAYLSRIFGGRWIGRRETFSCPVRSPDLSSIDFFVWGAMKAMVYETTVDSAMDLVARISVAAESIRKMPGIFQNIRLSMKRRCELCILAHNWQNEYLF